MTEINRARQIANLGADVVSVKDFGAVGDGNTNDTGAIQAALDYAESFGTYVTVIVPHSANEYIFTQLTVASKITFKSEGGVLKLKSGTAIDAGTNYYPVNNLGATEVTFDGLIIEGNSANNTLYNVCDSITCTGEGSVVKNCKIIDAVDAGIMFTSARHGQCINNYINGTRDAGIYVNNSNEADDEIEGATIQGNVIQGSGRGGINIKRSTGYIVVDSNTIKDCGNGMTVEEFGTGSGGEPDHLIISNNVIKDIGGEAWRTALDPVPDESGLNIQLSQYCSVIGNKFVNISGLSIGFDGAKYCTVIGNSMTGNQSDPRKTSYGNLGVRFRTRDTIIPQYNSLIGNVITGMADEGIYVVNGSYNTISGNVVDDVGADISNPYGLRLDSASELNNVINNIINGPVANKDIFVNNTNATNVVHSNTEPNNTGILRSGIRSSNIASPLGSVTPRFSGEMFHAQADSQFYIAEDNTSDDWVEIQSRPVLETAAALADKTSSVNTDGKYSGRLVTDSTNWELYIATGTTDISIWRKCDGSADITPS